MLRRSVALHSKDGHGDMDCSRLGSNMNEEGSKMDRAEADAHFS